MGELFEIVDFLEVFDCFDSLDFFEVFDFFARRTLGRYPSATVGELFDVHADGVRGQEFFDEFGPLDEADGARVEVVLVAEVIDFVELLDAVEVKVVDEFARRVGAVLVDDGERGRSHRVLHTESAAERTDERGLARAHFAVEGKHRVVAHLFNELLRGLGQGLYIGYEYFHRLVFSLLKELSGAKIVQGERRAKRKASFSLCLVKLQPICTAYLTRLVGQQRPHPPVSRTQGTGNFEKN